MRRVAEHDLSARPRRIRQPGLGSRMPGPVADVRWLDAVVKMSRLCSSRLRQSTRLADVTRRSLRASSNGRSMRKQPLAYQELHGRGYNGCWVASWWYRRPALRGHRWTDRSGHHGGLSLGHRGQPPPDGG